MSGRQVAGLKILFGQHYDKWSWKQEQLSYTTPVYIAEKIADLVKRLYKAKKEDPNSKIKVWDMFAGLGVDSVCLGLEDFEVHGTELFEDIYELLEKNIKSFGLEDKIKPYHSDCLEKLSEINSSFRGNNDNEKLKFEYDIIYFDPPWGESFNGNKLFDFDEVTLSNGIFIIDLLREIYTNYTQNIVIKSPLKCNTFENLDFIKIKRVVIFRKHHLKFIFT